MVNDPKVKCSAKKPERIGKLGLQAWRERWSAYHDAYAMAWCTAHPARFAKAFYGVEMKWVIEVI